MKRVRDLRMMSTDQLNRRLPELEIELHRARAHKKVVAMAPVASSKSKDDTKFMKRLRKEKARILTILRERELRIR